MIIFGNEYELPKLTVEVGERMEDAGSADTLRERAKKRHAFIRSLLGAEACDEIVGGKSYDKADTRRIDVAYMLIKREYEQPVIDEQRRTLEDQAEALKAMSDMVDSVANAAKIPSVLSGFSAVRGGKF